MREVGREGRYAGGGRGRRGEMSARAHGRTGGGSGRTAGAGAHLTHDTAHGPDKRRTTRHAEGWLDTLQAQRLAQVGR